jgi:AraC-like DNA-binding protein
MIHLRVENDADLSAAIKHYFASAVTVESTLPLRCLSVETPSMRGSVKDVAVSPGLNLTAIDFNTNVPLQFQTAADVPATVEIGHTLSGAMDYGMKGYRRRFGSNQGQSHLTIARGEMDSTITVPAPQHYRSVEFRCTPDSFDEYCRLMDCVLPKPLQRQLNQNRDSITSCISVLPKSFSKLQRELADEAFSCRCSSLKLERLIMDLTWCMIKHLNLGLGGTTPRSFLDSRDIERIREARHILEKNLDNPPNLLELARMVGLNDNKLKSGFRQAFGSTVHGTLTDMRLKRARALLFDGGSTVTEVALSVGYRNLGDFGIAFKKRYGISPSGLMNAQRTGERATA